MFVAVGDEGRQWVDMVGMLHHWDFIGLLMKKRNKEEEEAQIIYEQEVTNNATSVSDIRVKTELPRLQPKMYVTITHPTHACDSCWPLFKTDASSKQAITCECPPW